MQSAKLLLLAVLLPTFSFLTTAPVFAASHEKVLHNFGKGNDGVWPYAGLIFDKAGKLYGTTTSGGVYGGGTVFQLTRNTHGEWGETILHSFQNDGKDGYWPFGGVILDLAGNLYGTTTRGGASDCGTIFRLSPGAKSTWEETIMHSFTGQDGSKPYSSLTFGPDKRLYGTTFEGGDSGCDGVGCGTIFLILPASSRWMLKVLHRFQDNGIDGHHPIAGVIFDAAGSLYGTTAYGPTSGYDNEGLGIVFQLVPDTNGTWGEKLLYSFNSGGNPYAGLILDAAGNLYGTTLYGGSGDSFLGNVFQLTPDGKDGWSESALYNFCAARYNCNDGTYPYAGVIFDASGNLYGTTYQGGASGSNCDCGIVFQLVRGENGTWTENLLYSFNGQDGGLPLAGLVLDSAGNLYGTTNGGGAYGNGSVFEITP